MFSAELSGPYVVARLTDNREELAWNEVDLTQVRQTRVSPSIVPVPHIFAGVGVAGDAMPFHQRNAVLHRLAEAVFAVGSHCDDLALDGLLKVGAPRCPPSWPL